METPPQFDPSTVLFCLDETTLQRIREAARSSGLSFGDAIQRIVALGLPPIEREVLGFSGDAK